MIKSVFISFFLFLTYTGNTQSIQKVSLNELVSDFIKVQKADTVLTYERYHGGDLRIVHPPDDDPEMCIADLTNHPVYVFWKEKGKTYSTKINYCYEYATQLIENDDFWKIYFSNKKIIENEKVKSFEFITIEKSKKVKRQLALGNSSFQTLKSIINGKKIEFVFDEFDFQKTDDHNSPIKNMSYQNNINLKSKLIADTLGKIVTQEEQNDTFKKTKSR